jgi:hypothetical protein
MKTLYVPKANKANKTPAKKTKMVLKKSN